MFTYDKICTFCSKQIPRKILYDGSLQPPCMYKKLKYCSHKCASSDKGGRDKGHFKEDQKKCMICSAVYACVKDTSSFCSRKCAGRAKAVPSSQLPEKKCRQCEKTMQRKVKNGKQEKPFLFHRRKYCSRKCAGISNAPMPKTPINEIGTRHGIGKRLRTLMSPVACMVCGKTKDETALMLHHVDHDWRNNNHQNISVLCRSCHTRHHAYDRWKMHRRGVTQFRQNAVSSKPSSNPSSLKSAASQFL